MDGLTTGIDSAVHGEYRPNGQIISWTNAIKAKNGKDRAGAIVGIVTQPTIDAITGYRAVKIPAENETRWPVPINRRDSEKKEKEKEE